MKVQLFILSLFLGIGLCLPSCGGSTDRTKEPMPLGTGTATNVAESQIPTRITQPSTPDKAVATGEGASTSTPPEKVTSRAVPTLSVTFTPLPTLNNRGILGLIDDNGGCQLPCWWGMRPGQTTAEQAIAFLRQFVTKVDSSQPSSVDVDGKVRSVIGYSVEYPLPGSTEQGKLRFYAWDGIITTIRIGPETTQYRYTLDQLLSKIGKPSKVFVEAKYDAMGYTVPFKLILYYPNQRFFAVYYMEAERSAKDIRACPAKTAPGIAVWSTGYKIENRLADETLGPDSRPGLQTLEDSTGLSIDDFFAIFSKAGFNDCLESPLVFWKSLK